MAHRIPQDVIEKIRDEIPVEDVVRHFLPLRPSGRSFVALCPFHTEKTPSFHVNPERGIFYCFGCQKGGDVYRFLMEKEGMSFPEAVEWCASRLGIDLSRYAADEPGGDRRAALFAATAWAQEWFAAQLASPEGAEVRRYARGRGLAPETLEAFGLGYAPDSGQVLPRAAAAAGHTVETLLQTGLLGRKEGRSPFAYFRARLIFPVRGVASKIHGFGGRIVGPGEPKYLNSPETSIFQKRSILYALPEARAQIVRGRRALLVEGYLDALALHQSGWNQTVATCGTAFTPEQAAVLGRYAETVYLVFDGDRAGRKAAYQAADVALAGGLDVRIVRLPEGRDPADLISDGEVGLLQEAIETAPGLVGCMADEVARRGERREVKERALHHLRQTLGRVSDPIRAELMAQEAAEAFSVPRRLLEAEPAVGRRKRGGDASAPHATPHTERQEDSRDEKGPWSELESSLLRHAMAGRGARRRLFEALGADDFRDPRLGEVFRALHDLDGEIMERCDKRLLDRVDEKYHAVAGRLLMEMPEGEIDLNAEIDTLLDHRAKLLEDERRAARREQMQRRYHAGEDWRGEIRTQDEDGVGRTGR